MIKNRASLIAGVSLIILGIIFLVSTLVPATWPVILIGIGVFFLIAMLMWRLEGLAPAGTVNLALGCILLYQSITQDWRSWYYLWPLVFASAGVGLLITRLLRSDIPALRSVGYTRMVYTWLGLGLLEAAVLWVFQAQLQWPSIIWGVGAFFLLAALTSGVSPLAIPGSILGVLGLLLAWQNATQAWDSWAYAWALIPASVALGLFLAFLRSRVMRVVSLSMLAWSLVLFVVFGIFFAGDGALLRFWPAILILAGLMMLVQSLLVRRPPSTHLS